jgi:hypothetical protein
MSAAPGVVEIEVADEPEAWATAGFTVHDDLAQVGGIGIRLVSRGGAAKGVRSWAWSNLAGDGPIDGLTTTPRTAASTAPGAHPTGATVIDHIVVVTPNLERTVPAFEARGLDVRRVRDTDQYGPAFRQVFFRGGETIVELIGPDEPIDGDDRPAHFYGLAFTVADLDATATLLGEHISRPKDAVQPGRRIATLRHEAFDISVPIALMSV